jgi:acyl-coenzyme A synthetase/AMP-(fatty) acid ligase
MTKLAHLSSIRAGSKFLPELPKTASGKIQRFKLRQ